MTAIPLISDSSLVKSLLPMDEEIVRTRIGEIECTIFRDLMFKYQAKDYFTNAKPEELSNALNRYKIAADNIPSPFIATMIETGDRKLLIDTGIGYSDKPLEFRGKSHMLKGKLNTLLDESKIAREKITDLVITHFHPDHIGGIFSDDGLQNFPNATVHIHEKEWNYWHSAASENQPPLFKFMIEQKITPLKKANLNLLRGDFAEIIPGVTGILADGHTPGQLAVSIKSGSEQLLYISDAFLHPLHLEHLEWQTNYDHDHEKARKTRVMLAELAYKENMLVNAFHFDFPGLGKIDRKNNGWRWKNEGAVK